MPSPSLSSTSGTPSGVKRDALGRGPSRLVLGEVKGRGRSKGDLPLEPSVVKALRDH